MTSCNKHRDFKHLLVKHGGMGVALHGEGHMHDGSVTAVHNVSGAPRGDPGAKAQTVRRVKVRWTGPGRYHFRTMACHA